MKVIGLIGGMSWKSSLEYYKIINELISARLGGWHSAKLIMYSVDFDEIDIEHNNEDWKKTDRILIESAKKLEKAGADCVIICANTMHKLADDIQSNIKVPLIHIADATAERIEKKKIKNIGLLGTKFTMREDFYKGRLSRKYKLNVLVPEEDEIDIVNNEINNFILGKFNSAGKKKMLNVIDGLIKRGAEGIILGCTELPLIITEKDTKVPLFDTLRIHAEKAVEFSLT
jgi:aspartate racemase